jgi:hypothetical protein
MATEKKRADAVRKRARKKMNDNAKKNVEKGKRELLDIEDSYRILASTRVLEIPIKPSFPSVVEVIAQISELQLNEQNSRDIKLLDQAFDYRILALENLDNYAKNFVIRKELKYLLYERSLRQLLVAEKKRSKPLLEYVWKGII